MTEQSLKRITKIGHKVTQSHRQSPWSQRTRSASVNFRVESLYFAIDECQTALRSWAVIAASSDFSTVSNIIVKNRLEIAKRNFKKVFKDLDVIEVYVRRLNLCKFKCLNLFVELLVRVIPLPFEILEKIWKYSQTGETKYSCPKINGLDDHDAWMSYIELKTIVNSVFRAVIKRGGTSHLDSFKLNVDNCINSLEKLTSKW